MRKKYLYEKKAAQGRVHFTPFYPQKFISVESIMTVHYFEYKNTFSFAGEKHDFWELVCVDKGEINIFNGSKWHDLKRGEIQFHQPNEFHSLKANGKISPNVVVISFVCNSPAMDFFRNKILSFTDKEQQLLSQIIAYARNAFATPLDDPYVTHMVARKSCAPYSGQLIALNLELLLCSLYQQHNSDTLPRKKERIRSYTKASYENKIIERTIEYFTKNIRHTINARIVCNEINISYDLLKTIFAKRFHCGPMKYFSRMKIEEIKTQIRNSAMNMTELARYFGYSSIHYFSRSFKRESGMSPTEYSASIQAGSEA